MVKNDKLDALIMLSGDVLIQRNVELFKSRDTSGVVRPKSLDRRVQRTIDKEHRIKEYGYLLKPVKAFVAAILIICTVSFAAVMSVDAVRESIWQAIVNLYNDFFEVVFVGEADVPEVLEEKREPKLVPAEWRKEVVKDNMFSYSVRYYSGETIVLNYLQSVITNDEQMGDNEKTSVCKIAVGKYEGIVFEYIDKKYTGVKWCDNEYSYYFTADSEKITLEQLIQLATSVA